MTQHVIVTRKLSELANKRRQQQIIDPFMDEVSKLCKDSAELSRLKCLLKSTKQICVTDKFVTYMVSENDLIKERIEL